MAQLGGRALRVHTVVRLREHPTSGDQRSLLLPFLSWFLLLGVIINSSNRVLGTVGDGVGN